MAALDGTYPPIRFTIAQDGAAYMNNAPFYNDAGTDISSQLEALADVVAADLTKLGDVTVTAAQLNQTSLANGTHTITVGSQTGDDIPVTIQLKDLAGNDLATRASLRAYLSSASSGEGVTATGPDGGMAAGTDGACFAIVANKFFEVQSEADGDIDLVVTEAATGTWYLVLVKPNGSLAVSGAITFA